MTCSTDRYGATFVVASSLGPPDCQVADFTDIQAAINALPPAGGKVFVKAGTYVVSLTIGAYNGPAPALAKTAMPFEGFLGQIRNPSNDMPAYAAQVMSDQAVADIYAYMQSLPGPQQAKDIAILND